ncbi:hypothetical protein [Salimicrobium flavidum]|uniref:Uncharacterized protein n=1 Tax=Salimicrobium flavidum TaxID=570947 RepID=A0A1N7JI24_9BACI|nr:hypothetical protein [Salimicrobium flavidum]SIS48977.1 hypothetical protein SAMN05421687_10676 [Salimicrobium flavidum]
MNDYLKQLEPVEVRYLIDTKELREIVTHMLGEADSLVSIYLSYDYTEDETDGGMVRPMIELEEISGLTEENRHTILSTGLNLDAPFDNGDEVFRAIFGSSHVVIDATEDNDGTFFTVEVPYEDYKNLHTE